MPTASTRFRLISGNRLDRLAALLGERLASPLDVDSLAADDELAAQIAKMRLFAGMTLEELALSLGLSRTVIHRQWTYARAWLKRAMSEDAMSDDF